jgi:hypothetical protein
MNNLALQPLKLTFFQIKQFISFWTFMSEDDYQGALHG